MSRGDSFRPSSSALGVIRAVAAEAAAPVVSAEPGAWFAGLLDETRKGLLSGDVRLCAHVVIGDSAPVFLLPAERHRIMCAVCCHAAIQAIRGTIEDHLCDLCGVPVEPLEAFMLAIGRLLVTGGACSRCFPGVAMSVRSEPAR